MSKIIRDPAAASKLTYDLIIIGGGIYGVMLAFEASKRKLRCLLLEKSDFGGETSFNCLRILHGGFRYLQTADLHRFRESVNERKWFLKHFHGLVKPLPCLMPLYGKGLRRPSIVRIAALINDILSFKRNDDILNENHLPGTQLIDPSQVKRLFPNVNERGLKAGVVWYDAFMPDPQLVLLAALKKACDLGCTALNYLNVIRLVKIGDRVDGVIAQDVENDRTYQFTGNTVINAAGPWCRDLAAGFDKDIPELFTGSLAWNILFDKDSISSHALAVAPKKPNARTYFIIPWKGKLLAGTGHASINDRTTRCVPSSLMIQGFLDDLNMAIPELKLEEKEIVNLYSGLLPVIKKGTVDLTVRETIINHGADGGPKGLFSISGVKYTTSRQVAEKTLKVIFPGKRSKVKTLDNILLQWQDSINNSSIKRLDFDLIPDIKDEKVKEEIQKIAVDESVLHIDDLIYRRTTLGDNPIRVKEFASYLCKLIGWSQSRRINELNRLNHSVRYGSINNKFNN